MTALCSQQTFAGTNGKLVWSLSEPVAPKNSLLLTKKKDTLLMISLQER